MLKTSCALIALLALCNPALAACATQADAAALKTAVMQQELMVAALQCHEAGAYNRFVISYRGELQASDAALKSFFIKRGGEHGEAGYDTFKTKAANLSGLEQARDSGAFCADAHALFAAASQNQGSLAQFVESRSRPLDLGNVCAGPVLASAARPALVKVAEAMPVGGGQANVKADVKPDVKADVVLAGVPDHAMEARPWRHDQAAPDADAQQDEDADAQDQGAPSYADADQDELPPRPRAWQIRQGSDERHDNGYGERGYGPPPGWYPPPRPRYRWVPRYAYTGW